MTAGKLIIGSSSVPNSLTRQLIYRVNLDSGANMAISASYIYSASSLESIKYLCNFGNLYSKGTLSFYKP